MTTQTPKPTPELATQPHTARFVDSWASILLDLLRAVAAMLVLLEHWRNVFFVDYPQLAGHRLLWVVPYVACAAGHQAVVVFFMLSGFFIGGTVFRALEKDQWDWRSYLVRRSVRLWIVLLPALLACLFWDKLGLLLGFAPALYHGGATNHMLGNVSQLLSPRLFLSNLFFLQGTYTPSYGSDGALWSLAFEFWYYILFPLGLFALLPSVRMHQRLICLALFVAVAWFAGREILLAFPIWLAGVLLLRVPSPRLSPPAAKAARLISPLLYAPVFFYLTRSRVFSGLTGDYILAVFTFLLLWILLSATGHHPPASKSPAVRASREFARFSYTLYAVHTPMIVFAASLIVHDARWQPTPIHLLVAGTVLLVAVVYSFALASLTEFRTDALRARIEHVLRIRPSASVLPSNPIAGN